MTLGTTSGHLERRWRVTLAGESSQENFSGAINQAMQHPQSLKEKIDVNNWYERVGLEHGVLSVRAYLQCVVSGGFNGNQDDPIPSCA